MILSRQITKIIANTLAILMFINPLGITAANTAETAQNPVTITLEKPNTVQGAPADNSEDNKKITDKEKQWQFGNRMLNYYLQNGKSKGPDWLKTTDIELNLSENNKPVYSFETIQRMGKMTAKGQQWFWQGRYAYDGVSSTANIGFGWRKLSQDKSSIIGLNAFYDYGWEYNLARVGLGAEYFNKLGEYRVNWYYPVSGERQTHVSYLSDGILYSYIRAVQGMDFEAGTSFTHMSWLKLYAGGYYWDNKHNKDEKGYRLRSTIQLTPNFHMELGYTNSNLNRSFYGNLKYQLAFDGVSQTLQDKEKGGDISKKLLQKVERQNEIKTETWTKFVAYTGHIKTTVTNSINNTVIAGATVQAYQNGAAVGSAAVTDASGTAIINGLVVGTYTVYVTYGEAAATSNAVTVTKDTTVPTDVSLAVNGSSAAVKVLNAQLAAVSGASVTATLINTTVAKAEKGWFERLLGIQTVYAATKTFHVTLSTDANGVASFTNLPPGTYSFTTSNGALSMQSQNFVIAANVTNNLTIILPSSGGNIYTVVKDTNKAVLPGAVVKVMSGSTAIATGNTDSDGAILLGGIPTGMYTLSAALADYSTSTTSVTVANGATSSTNLTLTRQTGGVKITVTFVGGTGVTPTFYIDSVSTPITPTATSGNAYSFDLPTGSHTINAAAPDYTSSGPITVNVASGTTAAGSLTLTRQTGSAQVTVSFIGGASVTPTFYIDGASTPPTATSGNTYRFVLPTGSHTINAAAADYTSSGPITVNVASGTTAAGSLSLTRQTGSAEVTVSFVGGASVTPTFYIDGASTPPTATSGNTYRFVLPTGSHTINAAATDYTGSGPITINVASGTTAAGSLSLTRQTGSAEVTISFIGGASVTPTFYIDGASTPPTATSGNTYRFVLPTGSHTINAGAANYTSSGPITVNVASGTTAAGSLSLTRQTGSAEVTVSFIGGASVTPTFYIDGASTSPSGTSGNTYRFVLPTGSHTINAAATDYTSSGPITVNVASGTSVAGSLSLTRQTGSAEVTVSFVGGASVTPTFYIDGASTPPTATSGNTYRFVLPTGSHTINAAATDYTSSGPITVNVASGTTAAGSISLTRQTGSAEVTISFVGGASVTPTFYIDGASTPPTATSGNTYRFVLPTGSHTINAAATDYTSSGPITVNVASGTTAAGSLSLTRQTGSAEVTISFIGGASVTPTFYIDGASTSPSGTSGNTYRFVLPTGSHTINAAAADYTSSGPITVNVASGTTAAGSLSLTRQTGSAEVTITFVGGTGATPTFYIDGASTSPSGTSGNTYRFVLPTGSHTINAAATDYTSSGPITINIANGTTAAGSLSLTRQTGSAEVTITFVGGTGETPTFYIDGASTSPSGTSGNTYRFVLPTGSHTINAAATDYTSSGPITVIVTSGTSVAGGITLTRQTGSAKVTVTFNDGETNVTPIFKLDNTNTITGTEGITKVDGTVSSITYTFTNLPTGSHTISAAATNYNSSSAVSVTVTTGASDNQTIALTRQTGHANIFVNPGNSVIGATVSVMVNGKRFTAISDDWGIAHFYNLPTGTYAFTAAPNGFGEGLTNVTIVNGQTVISSIMLKQEKGNAEITVTDGTNPLKGAQVSVMVNGAPQTQTTNDAGVVSFTDLYAGSKTFTAQMPIGYTTNSVAVNIPSNGTGKGTIILTPALTITLHFIKDDAFNCIIGHLEDTQSAWDGPKINNFEVDTTFIVPRNGNYRFNAAWKLADGSTFTAPINITINGIKTYNITLKPN